MFISARAAAIDDLPELSSDLLATVEAAKAGLMSNPKMLPPWLFYDEAGSELFEQITRLPEYYLTRTERHLFSVHADDILGVAGDDLMVVELGAGTATKTGILLNALLARQQRVVYQPIDISPSALDEACSLEAALPGLVVRPQVANYVTEGISIEREEGAGVLALYIGSSIGNFSPDEARSILKNLRTTLEPGDSLLLGTDLAPSHASGSGKGVSTLLAAYNDGAGVTAAFNRNILFRLNRELRMNFRPDRFRHVAIWNEADSRIEMHLQSVCAQTVHLPLAGLSEVEAIHFTPGETIHTENSYKFDSASIELLLRDSGFEPARTFTDRECLFAVTLAAAV